jgi:hypothetical protein
MGYADHRQTFKRLATKKKCPLKWTGKDTVFDFQPAEVGATLRGRPGSAHRRSPTDFRVNF